MHEKIKIQSTITAGKISSVPVWNGTKNSLHHGQMFAIIVGLKESDAQVEFKKDASNRPDIARLRPTQFYAGSEKQKHVVNYGWNNDKSPQRF